ARAVPPGAWTFRDVESAVLGEGRATMLETSAALPSEGEVARAALERRPVDAAEGARLALALSRSPADAAAIEVVERAHEPPRAFFLGAGEALRLRGELGRARSLVLPLEGADDIAAEVLRRSGDTELATNRAHRAIEAGRDPDHRARAVLGRLALDAGRLGE